MRASQVATVLLMLASCVVTYFQDSIAGAWKLLIALGAGTGSVLILRWFWWRINAWSEVSAMAASFVVSPVLTFGFDMRRATSAGEFAWMVLITVACSTVTWLSVTFPDRAGDREDCCSPSTAGCGRAPRSGDRSPGRPPTWCRVHDGLCNLLDWAGGLRARLPGALRGGQDRLRRHADRVGLIWSIASAAGWIIYWDLNRRGWETVME